MFRNTEKIKHQKKAVKSHQIAEIGFFSILRSVLRNCLKGFIAKDTLYLQ